MIHRTPVPHGWISQTTARGAPRPLAVSALWVLLLGVAGAMPGCADRGPTGPGAAAYELIAAQPGTAVMCAPLPADSVTATIGPAGGKIAIGRHVLAVPKDALTEAVAITAVVRPDTINVVRFQPDGLVFLKTATLTMYYGNCPTPSKGPRPRIAHVSDQQQLIGYVQPPPGKGPKPPFVQGALQHFSNYAVAW